MVNINNWFKETNTYLDAADVLYNARKYKVSFECFQQAVELANKTLASFLDNLSVEQLKDKISHKPLKYYSEKVNKSYSGVLIISALGNVYPNLKENEFFKLINPGEEYLKMLEQGKKEFDAIVQTGVTLNYRQLKYIVESLLDLEEFQFSEQINEDNFIDGIKEASGFLRLLESPKLIEDINKLDSALIDPAQRKVIYDVVGKFYIEIMPDLMFILYTFFACAVITNGHYDKSRYSGAHTTPTDVYTKKHPIVRVQPDLINMLDSALLRFDDLIKKLNETVPVKPEESVN